MYIKYYTNFSKKRNSTKQPTGGTQTSVVLKMPTSIERPVFRCTGVPATCNYIYVSEWGHYYYVTDITYITTDVIEISCVQDVLASYKTDIGSYSGFIEYAASEDNLSNITDPRIAVTNLVKTAKTAFAPFGSAISVAGSFMVGVINSYQSVGGITYYNCTPAQLASLKAALVNQTIWDALKFKFNSIDECIISCIWVPFSQQYLVNSGLCTSAENVSIAGVYLNVNGCRLIGLSQTFSSGDVDITYPYDSLGNTYLNVSPYSTGVLYLPFVGAVDFDIDLYRTSGKFNVSSAVDLRTGDVVYTINNTVSGSILATYSGNMAAGFPLASKSFDAVSFVQGALFTVGGVVASAVTGGAALPAVGAAAVGTIKSGASLQSHSALFGRVSGGASAALNPDGVLTVVTKVPVDETLIAAKTIQGLPVMGVNTVNSYSGFIKMRDASIDIDGFEGDKEEINGYMNSGFYYE